MWRRGAGVLAAVLAVKTNQRCHVLAEAGAFLPASLHTAAQHTEHPSSSTIVSDNTNSRPGGQHGTQQKPAPEPSSTCNSSNPTTSSSSSSSKASRWPPSLQEGTHFAVLTGEGLPARLSSIAAAMQLCDVLLLGEYHDDPVAHALQLELLKRAAKVLGYQLPPPPPPPLAAAAAAATRVSKGGAQASSSTADSDAADRSQQQQGMAFVPSSPQRPLVLSLEMFERDVQPVLDEYLAGTASLADLMRDARPWPNYRCAVRSVRSRSAHANFDGQGLSAVVADYDACAASCMSFQCPFCLSFLVLHCRRDYQPLVDFCKGLAALHNTNSTTAAAAAAVPELHCRMNGNSNSSDTAAPGSSTISSSNSSAVRVIAANAPRRYVSLAGRAGRDALLQLPAAAQAFLAPLPYAQPSKAYVEKVTGSMRQAAVDMQQQRVQQQQQQEQEHLEPKLAAKQHSSAPAAQESQIAAADGGACPYIGFSVSSNFLDAQCLWDSTMAHSIAQQLLPMRGTSSCGASTRQATAAAAAASSIGSVAATATGTATAAAADKPHSSTPQQQQQQQQGPLVIHLCGKFHAEHRLGIPEHLQQYVPGARVLVVTFVPADSMALDQQQFEAAGLKGSADFVVLTDGSLPRSFASVHPV
jgi:uncharacterized iron-regulated protein